MKRTSLFLTDKQIKKIARIAKNTGLKASELKRRFIDEGLQKFKD